ncbi:MAG TPA: acetate--CoA ligase family protein [Thermoanaerobaculia bacterium]|nr:acetate--CoA ligase family protein [Thermoanaerobaculia bacterium]
MNANQNSNSLDPFFQPTAVAVVGASSRESSVGYALLKNLLYGSMRAEPGEQARKRGFQGPVYAVNPKGGEILGQPVHENLAAIGEPVDLIVVAIPPKYIPGLMDEAAAAGVGAAIVISAGFAEMGDEGKALQDTMMERARAGGIRLVGPNCLGVLRPAKQLNASFAETPPTRGAVGLLSQSGALITGVISYSHRERFGLSAAVSLGSKADVEDEDVLLWLADDPETRSLAIYVESFTEPASFLAAAKQVAASKPVVALKGGATAAGAKAASSHTGSLAGSAAAYHAAFTQCGVLEAGSIGELIDWSRALAHQPLPAGRRIAIVTNAGGPGVLSADAASRAGLELAELSPETFAALDEVLPAVWSRNNPVDVIGDATPERYRAALDTLGKAPEVDAILVILTVQAMTDPRATAEAIAEAHRDESWQKPLVASFLGLVGTEVGSYLDERGVPEYNLPEAGVGALTALVRRAEWLRREEPAPPENLPHPEPDLDRARELVAEAIEAGHENLPLDAARHVLAAAGIRYNRSATAADADEAVAVAEEIGYPVVLKVISPDVIHKSDVGGVVLNVADADGVREACRGIAERVEAHQPGARIDGFTVEQQVSGTEVIVGVSRDPDFGPLLMVGMGGVFVEVYKDVAFRLVPFTRGDAIEAIGEIEAQALLDGARGRPVLDRGELAEVLLRVSALVEAVPGIAELDVNPLVITDHGLVAIDARVIVG